MVSAEIHRREVHGEPDLAKEYHRRADPLYELPREDSREEGFRRLNRDFFTRLGYPSILAETLREFPDPPTRLRSLWVARATRKWDEGIDLGANGSLSILRLRPASFADVPSLRRMVRHEWAHLCDMLDPAFGYGGRSLPAGLSPPEENLVRERYRVLWDIRVESRLSRLGLQGWLTKEKCRQAFNAGFAKLPACSRPPLFERLWSFGRWTHREILEIALDPRGLLSRFSDLTEALEEEEKSWLFGGPCPLCSFPTWEWETGVLTLEDHVQEAIRSDFPGWRPEDGACRRCVESYRFRALLEAEKPVG
ncbi:MAG: hypothetical protein ACE5JS_04575 [Nitrospinota bacterium]